MVLLEPKRKISKQANCDLGDLPGGRDGGKETWLHVLRVRPRGRPCGQAPTRRREGSPLRGAGYMCALGWEWKDERKSYTFLNNSENWAEL